MLQMRVVGTQMKVMMRKGRGKQGKRKRYKTRRGP
jgi:hypothetical protein